MTIARASLEIRVWSALLAAAACSSVVPASVGQDLLAIRGGRILPISAAPLDGGIILIRNGRIEAVGKDVEIPVEAKVLDATGKVIMPGFVEPHSSGAMSQSNEVNPNVPFLSVVDTIDPSREYFEESRRNGVTTDAVVPGNSTMIGGQAAVIKTAGTYVDEMLLKRQAGMKISLSPPGNASRMSHYARLRREFQRAREYLDGVAEVPPAAAPDSTPPKTADTKEPDQQKANPESSPRQPADPGQDEAQRAALARVLKGEFPAFIYCENGMDALQAIQLTRSYQLKSILVLGRQCYEAAQQIADSKLPVILDATLVYWRTDERTGKDEKIVVPQVFRKHSVPVTFQVEGASPSTLGNNYLWYQAAIAVKYGMPVDEALRALTLRPAEILGVAEFVGSIEPNKDADLVILSGDPLQVSTWVEKTIVNGRVVYEREKDEQLKRLLREPAP